MAEATNISWATHTFNPWRGCTKVAAGCTNCYADAMSKRNPSLLGIWGPQGSRVVASEKMWSEPISWNREADPLRGLQWGEKERPRVFCASLCDVFEDWNGPLIRANGDVVTCSVSGLESDMNSARRRLFQLIDDTHHLDWMILTKRPENIRRMTPGLSRCASWPDCTHPDCISDHYRDNVWYGTSISDQETADAMVPRLLGARQLASVLFLSIEPLLGPVELAMPSIWHGDCNAGPCSHTEGRGNRPLIDLVIIGGESGPNRRPCDIEWITSIVNQCREAGVACFVKQDAALRPGQQGRIPDDIWSVKEMPKARR